MDEGAAVRHAVKASLDEYVRTPDIQVDGHRPYTTAEVGQWIAAHI